MRLTQKIWDDFNSSDEAKSKRAAKHGDRLMKDYWKHVETILPLHRSRAMRFFKNINLHDSSILSINLGNLLSFSKTNFSGKTNFVVIKVLHPELNNIYILRYSWIKILSIKYSEDQHREKIYCNFGSWNDDELSLTKDKWLKHKILLDSGTTITIVFRHFSYKIEACKNEREMLKKIKQLVSQTMQKTFGR